MFLSCPACGARYRIDPGAWPANGDARPGPRRARCSACGTIFAARPKPETPETAAPETAEPETVGPDDDEADAPRRRRLLFPALLAVALLAVALLGITTWALLQPERVESLTGYRPPAIRLAAIQAPRIALPKIELPRIELPRIELPRAAESPLLVEARMARRAFAGGREAIEVTGSIRNPVGSGQPVPPVELLLFDSAGRLVGRWTARADARVLAPGESVRFESSNVDPPPDVARLQARLKPGELGRP